MTWLNFIRCCCLLFTSGFCLNYMQMNRPFTNILASFRLWLSYSRYSAHCKSNWNKVYTWTNISFLFLFFLLCSIRASSRGWYGAPSGKSFKLNLIIFVGQQVVGEEVVFFVDKMTKSMWAAILVHVALQTISRNQ